MENNNMDSIDNTLTYVAHDGAQRTIEGCEVSKDKAGRIWIWSEDLEQNIAYLERTFEDALKSAIDLLLLKIELKDKEITRLRRIEELALVFSSGLSSEYENE